MLAKIKPQDLNAFESLDEVKDISHIFDFIDELLLQQQKLKQHFSKGFMLLAQSKYVLGPSQVGRYQYKTSMEASVTVSFEKCAEEKEDHSELKLVVSDERDPSLNPLHWFGVLVPSSLRKAQTQFTDSLEIILEISKLQNRIVELERRLKEKSILRIDSKLPDHQLTAHKD